MSNIVSPRFGPKDFSSGLVHEMLITLGKYGFSPVLAKKIADQKTGMAKKLMEKATPSPRIKITTLADGKVKLEVEGQKNIGGTWESCVSPTDVLVDQAVGWAVRHYPQYGIQIEVEPV